MAKRFEAGKSYVTRSLVDSETQVWLEVTARTAKTLTAKTAFGIKTLRISEYEGVEQVKPWGSYSMCPIVGADRAADPSKVLE